MRPPRAASRDSPSLTTKRRLANVAGTAEPVYGPDAIRSVEQQARETAYTELTKDDLRWREPNYTCVETETFYFALDDGKLAYAQIIYNNVMYGPRASAHAHRLTLRQQLGACR